MSRLGKKMSISLIFILVMSNFVFAQTTTTTTDTSSLYTSDSAGITPDSFLYNLELAYENFQLAITVDPVAEAELLSSNLEERHAEMEAMLQQENYDALAAVSEAAQETYEDLHDAVESIPPTEENLQTIYDVEEQLLYQEDHIEEIHEELQAQVQSGELTAEAVEEIGFTQLEEAAVNAQAESENTEDNIVDAIAEEQGITTIEAQLIVEQLAEETGLLDLQEAEIRAELIQLEQTIEQTEVQLGELTQAGTEIPNGNELSQILDEAQLQLQRAEDFYTHGQIDNAFAKLTSSEQLALTAEQAVEQDVDFDYSELIDLAEEVEQEQQERIEEAEEYLEEYEEAGSELAERYPEKAEEFEYYNDQAQKSKELSEKLADSFGELREELLTEGKSEEEAAEIMGERWNQEYRILYGEKYNPPGINVIDEGIDPGSVIFGDRQVELVGGLIEGYEYTDPVTRYKYAMTENGYEYTTAAGITYRESWPENFNPEDKSFYSKGNEVHQQFEKTEEGTIIYNYFATGYEVVLPDGTTETFSYPKGEHEVLGGEKIEIDATGYKVESGEKEGEQYSHKYEYNPEFRNYAAKLDSGELVTFIAPEGAAEHDKMDYIGDSNLYTYQSGGESWLYNPASHSWKSSGGETYKPEATTLAPVGHEDSGLYNTNTGKTWEWDSSSKTWKDTATGESYNTESKQYYSSEGESWTYDSTTGSWTNPATGESHTDTSIAPGTSIDSGGVAWTYDSTTGSWGSSTGDSWSYDSSTGSWTNPATGESHTPTSGPIDGGGGQYGDYTPPS